MVAVLLPTLRHFRVVNIVALIGTTYTTWFIVAAAAKHGITPGAASRSVTFPPPSTMHNACQPVQPQNVTNNIAHSSQTRLMLSIRQNRAKCSVLLSITECTCRMQHFDYKCRNPLCRRLLKLVVVCRCH